jgi:tRNA-modifying protein YgfZ
MRTTMPERPAVELVELGVLVIRGSDAVRFLQGQLSNDLEGLAAGGSLLAGYHNPQGRAIAIVRLLRTDDELLAVMPRELVPAVAARLSRYVLRAKVQLRDDSARWRVRGITEPTERAELGMKVSDAPARWIALAPAASGSATAEDAGHPPETPSAARDEWTRLDIAAGLAQVYPATSELYVAQMLNLDLLGGIAFSKGCYTGQEVIARAHYRGRVKRRMQRWRTRERCVLRPGDAGQLDDGRAFRVIEAVQLPDGRSEFLAVAPIVAAGPHEEPDPASAGDPRAPASDATSALAVEPLPLPYPLPQ